MWHVAGPQAPPKIYLVSAGPIQLWRAWYLLEP
jgi:hypothetical protein